MIDTDNKILNESQAPVKSRPDAKIIEIFAGMFCVLLLFWFCALYHMHASFLNKSVASPAAIINNDTPIKVEKNTHDGAIANSDDDIYINKIALQNNSFSQSKQHLNVAQHVAVIQYYESFISLLITFCTLFIGSATIIFILQSALSFVSAKRADTKTKEVENKIYVIEQKYKKLDSDIDNKYNLLDEKYNLLDERIKEREKDLESQRRMVVFNEQDNLFSFFPSMCYAKEIFNEWIQMQQPDERKDFFSKIITNIIEQGDIDDPLLFSQVTTLHLVKSDKMACPVALSLTGLSRQLLVDRIADSKEKIQHLFAAKNYYTRAIGGKKISDNLLQYVETNKGAVLVKLAALVRKDKRNDILSEIDMLYSKIFSRGAPARGDSFIAYNAFNLGMSFLFRYVFSARFEGGAGSNLKEYADKALRNFEKTNKSMDHIATYSIARMHSEQGGLLSCGNSIAALNELVSFVKDNLFNDNYKKNIQHIFWSIHPDVFHNDIMMDNVRAARADEFKIIAASYSNSYVEFNNRADV